MIKSTAMLLDEFSNYQDSFGKINRLKSSGQLNKVTKGIYETDASTPGYLMSPVIYGPSYLSFDYALSRYGLIPESVHEYTNATFGKEKRKTYHNVFGDYSYRDVPSAVFPFETTLMFEKGYPYTIASAEKALCDKLYTLPPVKNMPELRSLLFDNLRIDETRLSELDAKKIENLSVLYKSNNVRFLAKFLKRYSK